MVAPFPDVPGRMVPSRDGTPIAVFSAGDGPATPVLLVHGTSADHRTWRVVAPAMVGPAMVAPAMVGAAMVGPAMVGPAMVGSAMTAGRRVHAIDRRGRGDSGDAPAWAIEREVEDVVVVVEALAADGGGPVDVVGHSMGGRLALAASTRTPAIRRIVAYEGAPAPGPDREDRDADALLAALRAHLAAGDLDELLGLFMSRAVGMLPAELDSFRADPIWARRAAAGPTIVRELDAALHDGAIGLDALAGAPVPVLQLVGGDSAARFRAGAEALHARLAHGRLEIIEGARHAAHHSHPAEFLARVEAFLVG